mmetsp:Transcript_7928/g.25217  ORF Transcript_7928/g.25217 Transcript_7928/m.25217 type:complete len:253 (+) Transcript_7928:731-1489(+)
MWAPRARVPSARPRWRRGRFPPAARAWAPCRLPPSLRGRWPLALPRARPLRLRAARWCQAVWPWAAPCPPATAWAWAAWVQELHGRACCLQGPWAWGRPRSEQACSRLVRWTRAWVLVPWGLLPRPWACWVRRPWAPMCWAPWDREHWRRQSIPVPRRDRARSRRRRRAQARLAWVTLAWAPWAWAWPPPWAWAPAWSQEAAAPPAALRASARAPCPCMASARLPRRGSRSAAPASEAPAWVRAWRGRAEQA